MSEEKPEGTTAEVVETKPEEQNQIPVITDEQFWSEASKRFEGKINGKEDIESLLSKSHYDDSYFKPKSDLIKKLNEWEGDPEMFITLSKLEPEKMDNKDAIVRQMMLKDGYSKEDAEFKYKRTFGYLDKAKDDEDFDEDKFKELSLDQNRAAQLAKQALSQFKVTETEKGNKKSDPVDNSKLVELKKKDWDAPLTNAVKSLEKLDFDLSIKHPDKDEVKDTFTFAATNKDTKTWIENTLVNNPQQFLPEFIKRFGKEGETPAQTLSRALYFLDNKNALLNEAASYGASRGVSKHLESVKPGTLKQGATSGVPGGVEKTLAEQFKEAAAKQRQI